MAAATEVVLYPFADFKAVIGDNFYCLAEALDSTGAVSTDTVAFTSSNTGVCTIDSVTGQYTPVANGTTTITATAGSASATRTMTVVTATPGVAIESAVTRAMWQSRIAALTSPGPVVSVDASYAGNLQNALNAAALSGTGWTLTLTPGTNYGNVVLPANTGALITITTSGTMPPRGTRMTEAQCTTYNSPRIWTNSINPAVWTDPTKRTHNYRFLGLDIGYPVGGSTKLSNYGAFYLDAGWSRLSCIAQDIYCDRVFFRGSPGHFYSRFGWSPEGAWCAAIDCDATEHHFCTGGTNVYPDDANSDSQGMRVLQGPGPIYAENCGWQSAHECVGIGGNDGLIANLLIRDVRLYRCYLNRPIAWRGVYTCKNLFEVKHGLFVEAENCVYDHAWVDQQHGEAFMLWAVNQGGTAAWTATRDVWIHGAVVTGASDLVNIADRQSNFASALADRLTVENVLIRGMDHDPETANPQGGGHSGRIFGPGAADRGSRNVTLRHITAFDTSGNGNGWGFVWDSSTVGKTWDGLVIEDNVVAAPTLLMSSEQSGAAVWTTKKGTNSRFRNNIAVDTAGRAAPSGGSDTNNTALSSITSDVMTTPANALSLTAALTDFVIPNGSPYKNTASDGTDPGADFTALAAFFANVVAGVGAGAGTADHLAVGVQPAGAVSGVALTTQPVVVVQDVSNATVTGDSSTVTASWVGLTGDASPSGTLTKAASSGVATFTNLTLTWTVASTGYWHFTDGALTSVNSSTLTLTVTVTPPDNPFGIVPGAPAVYRMARGKAVFGGFRRTLRALWRWLTLSSSLA